jgi:isoleucyl-tRNA synthetase
MIQTAKTLKASIFDDSKAFLADMNAKNQQPQDYAPLQNTQEYHTGKVYCANCRNCKLLPTKNDGEDRYMLRVRCAAGKWKKKLGEEKFYKYCTITRRYLDFCDNYEEMGDSKEFIRELRKSLHARNEVYLKNDEDD